MTTTVYSVNNVPQEITDLVVAHFRIVAHTMGPVAPGAALSQNHWSIYLLHAHGSVRLNMQLEDPTAMNTRGLLTVVNYDYTTVSTSAVRYWDFQAADNLAVYHVIQLILNQRRAAYDMNERGVGCRHWISTVMEDFVASSYVSATSTGGSLIANFIGYNYSVNQPPIPLEVQAGTFVQLEAPPNDWSEWEWTDEFGGQWYRYRLLANGTYEYEYQQDSQS